MANVELQDIDKRFDDGTHAVKSLSLRIEDGERLVLLGPSGCGKSTLLRILAGLDQPTSGTLRIDGKDVNGWSPQQRNVAMVFQNYALYPHMSVRGNLEFPLRMRRLARDERERRVLDAARILGLEELLERRPRQLSGGQRQRVAMGRALVRDPTVFLMDEPLSNLDAKLRVEIRGEIAALQARLGITTVYVTHDQVEALTLGQRVAVLRDGGLQQVDRPQALYDRPANIFTAAFLGSPAMSVFRPTLHRDAGDLRLELGGQRLPIPRHTLAGRAASQAQRPIALAGLRPEGFMWPDQAPELPTLTAPVATIESLGHEQIVHLRSPAPVVDPEAGPDAPPVASQRALLAARLPVRGRISPGDSLTLALDPDRLYWFDREGVTLLPAHATA